MDTSRQGSVIPRDKQGSAVPQRPRRSIGEKRRIVEETLAPGASGARVAREHGINANQLVGWQPALSGGKAGAQKPEMKLLPVREGERT